MQSLDESLRWVKHWTEVACTTCWVNETKTRNGSKVLKDGILDERERSFSFLWPV